MADWLESEFFAGLMVGVGGLGVPVGLTVEMQNKWLFVALSVILVVGGIGVYCMLNLDKETREGRARRILGLD